MRQGIVQIFVIQLVVFRLKIVRIKIGLTWPEDGMQNWEVIIVRALKEEQVRLGNQERERVMDWASNESADYQHIEKAQAALDG